VTKTDWEGTGVKPDVAVPANQALLAAHLLALKKQLTKYADKLGLADHLKRVIAGKEKELDALKTK
jgi:retinol-binding protein 3